MGPTGTTRSPVAVILLSLITLGIYFVYWQYATFKEMKEHSNEGIGGGLGLVIAIFLSIVNSFLIPSEVANLYKRRGQEPPVTALTGFWVLLPLVGFIIWVLKVQGRLNDYWEATPPLTEGFATPAA
jgi:amino acid transporter